jgi:hypothetical protein
LSIPLFFEFTMTDLNFPPTLSHIKCSVHFDDSGAG